MADTSPVFHCPEKPSPAHRQILHFAISTLTPSKSTIMTSFMTEMREELQKYRSSICNLLANEIELLNR